MNRAKPKPVTDAREFFAGELKTVMQKRRITAQRDSFEYLVNLLLRYMESQNFFVKDTEGRLKNNVLADMYATYMNGNAEEKTYALRRLGDICLIVTGFFPDSLNRKIVDIDYYFGMGGTAYAELAKLQFTSIARSVYAELSANFKPFSDVLGELSEQSGLQTNSDILRLYEKWLLTGSDRLRKALSEKGIHAPNVDTKVRH